jgi:hypothetical protein
VRGSQRARRARRLVLVLLAASSRLNAEGPSPGADAAPAPSASAPGDEPILGPTKPSFRIDSVMTRMTGFDQFGHGFQAQGGPILGAGSERTTIFEPQVEVNASQGDRVKHNLWIPIDIVTAASPHAIDVLTSASRHVEAGSLDWAATYKNDPTTDLTVRSGLHLENPFRSWHGGLAASRAFAEGNTVLSAGLLEVFDWFDRFDIHGGRHGRTDRSSTTANAGLTQILTPTTIANVNYGITVQRGELGNTWNSVPLMTGDRGPELLPGERVRHAVVGRAAQFLPWNGALHLDYRFYADDWGVIAHSVEGEILQRLSPSVYVGATYRFHRQRGVSFFTTLANPEANLRTADSDLASFDAQTVGGKVAIDVPVDADFRTLHVEVGVDRYVRTNDLQMNVVTCATGYRF